MTTVDTYQKADILDRIAQPPADLLAKLASEPGITSDCTLVVLDDDPTGTQCVHDVSVYTDWSVDSLRQGFAEPAGLFYVLTNSRSFTEPETIRVHAEIGSNLIQAAAGRKFLVISRSDSTLRGHYPTETQVLRQTLEQAGLSFDGEILIPFFLEGGRYTIEWVHYVKSGDRLIPAAETEFARDATFGYTVSSLKEYIQEKTQGAVPADDVMSVSLELLASGDVNQIFTMLMSAEQTRRIVVNATSYGHLAVFCSALNRAIRAGKNFIFRTAASFVRVFGGIEPRDLLTEQELRPAGQTKGGLVVVGSHTEKTTAQLKRLLELPGTVAIPFHSELVLDGETALEQEVHRCVELEEQAIAAGKCAVCFTARQELRLEDDTPETALRRSVAISDGVQKLVGELAVSPAYLVAKGGITSSDVATKALKIRHGRVMGQIEPGVPVWETGPESRFPGIPYVIFPGNVGEETTLRNAVEKLMGRGDRP